MKKKIRIIYIVLFFIICIIPVAFMPFVKNDTSKENRKLSQMPSLTDENKKINLEWSSQFETYLSEHFAFREKLVTADSIIKSVFLKTSSNEKVIVGKNNWLYFSSTLDDYTGNNRMSERRINNTAKTLSLMQEYCTGKGSQFLFMTAPNKNTVYPQYMPSRYIKSSSESNLEMLNRKLQEYSVNYLDVVLLFQNQKNILYHTRDSHWTNEGALLIYNEIMDRFNLEHENYISTYHQSEIIWNGDLDSMLFPSAENLSEQIIYDIDYSFEYTYNFKNSDDMLIKTKNENAENNIVMYRDSFGRSLYPFFAENTNKALFSRETPYKMDLISENETNLTIIEIVERNLDNLTEKAPIMKAPLRSIDISASIDTSKENSCFTLEKNNLLKIYGKLDEKYFENNSDIYITLENDGTVLCFEAFPIYEAELLEDTEQYDYGYSLYINTEIISSGNYAINAYISTNDGFICTDTLKNIEL